MKRFLIRLLGITIFVLAGFATISLAQPSGFTGAWNGTDPVPPEGDGSNLNLFISGSSTVHVSYSDDEATAACPTGLDEGDRARFTATGTISGNILTVTDVQVYCFGVSGRTEGPFLASIVYDYDPATDTITDQFGAVFTRTGMGS